MVDFQFADAGLAAFYDVLHPWDERDDLAFYLPMAMSAGSVLDVGCGTGSFLHRLREQGHPGRLCGLDPGAGMLRQAAARADIDWILGTLDDLGADQRFDLIVMTGHAFQVLVTDDELRAALAVVRGALTAGGRFAFETRNPLVRAWERWTPEHAVTRVDGSGEPVRMEHRVDAPVTGQTVTFTATYTSPGWPEPLISRSTLRFLDRRSLAALLSDAGLAITAQYGDWDGSPLTDASPEIITIAGRADVS